MSDERVWLKHEDTGHFFECSAGAVEAHGELGWAPTNERPEEVNPVTAENVAWQAEQRAAAERPPEQPITASAGSAPESEE